MYPVQIYCYIKNQISLQFNDNENTCNSSFCEKCTRIVRLPKGKVSSEKTKVCEMRGEDLGTGKAFAGNFKAGRGHLVPSLIYVVMHTVFVVLCSQVHGIFLGLSENRL